MQLRHGRFGRCGTFATQRKYASNTSPSLASRLRQSFEQLFDAHFASYLNARSRARKRVREKVGDRTTRFALLRALVRGFSIEGNASLSAPLATPSQCAADLRTNALQRPETALQGLPTAR